MPDRIGKSVRKPGKRLGSGKFRLSARKIMLTFPQATEHFNVQRLEEILQNLGASWITGKEKHGDGGVHFHCYVDFGRRWETENPRFFDVESRHPNILVVYSTPENVWDYATKDNDIVGSGTCPRPASSRSKRSRDDDWAAIGAATSRDEFFETGEKLATRDFYLYHEALEQKASKKFRVEQGKYRPDEGLVIHWESIPEIRRWVLESLLDVGDVIPDKSEGELALIQRSSGLGRSRRKSLILYGKSQTFKTEVARALGHHAYFCNMFNLDDYEDDTGVHFAIFDDIVGGLVKGMPSHKAWLGAQKEFVCTDKYRRKVRIKWNKPCIWISNHNPLGEHLADVDWLERNCIIVEVDKEIAHFN